MGRANYSSYGEDTSFIWTVEPPYNVSSYPGGGSYNPDAPTANLTRYTLGRPGDMTIFVVSGPPNDSSANGTTGTQYWTSPMYIVGNDPLPSNNSTSLTTGAGDKRAS